MEFEFQGIEQSSEININIIKEIIDTKIKKSLCYKFKVLSGGKVPISSSHRRYGAQYCVLARYLLGLVAFPFMSNNLFLWSLLPFR